jgi:hypothetical protein
LILSKPYLPLHCLGLQDTSSAIGNHRTPSLLRKSIGAPPLSTFTGEVDLSGCFVPFLTTQLTPLLSPVLHGCSSAVVDHRGVFAIEERRRPPELCPLIIDTPLQ